MIYSLHITLHVYPTPGQEKLTPANQHFHGGARLLIKLSFNDFFSADSTELHSLFVHYFEIQNAYFLINEIQLIAYTVIKICIFF